MALGILSSKPTSFLCDLAAIIAILITPNSVFAGACCGGGSSVSGLILGDERHLFGLELDSKETSTDVSAAGVWRNRQEPERQLSMRIHLASLISDRLQIGISPSLVRKSRFGDGETSFGDTTLVLGYEVLPNWDYHPIRPRGTAYLSASIPTGRSVYESQSIGYLDAAGKGFPSFGLGLVLNKSFAGWTAMMASEIHHGIDKAPVYPSWGYSVSANLSFDLGKWQNGLSIDAGFNHIFQNSFRLALDQNFESISSLQVTTPSIGLSYAGTILQGENEDPTIVSLTYSDQRLLGDPINTPLGKSITLGVRKQILR